MEFFVSHKNTNKGGEVMDSGASSYHICGSIDKNKIIMPTMLSPELISLVAKKDLDDLLVFPISDIDIKKGL